jgi:epoxyqueuosine reductase QueG
MNNLVIHEISRTITSIEAELNIGRIWKEPIIHFISSGNSELAGLKASVSPDHLLPSDILAVAESIISFFIPFHEGIVKSNMKNIEASKEWAAAYIYTNDLIRIISNRVEIILNETGYRVGKIPATHNFDRIKLISNWSHRHIAYIARLGTFGINNMLITDKGCCGRLGSIITDCKFTYQSTEKLNEKCLNKSDGSCGFCRNKCIADAYAGNQFDRHKCYEKCLMNAELHKDTGYADVCGKCLVGLPCSSSDPTVKPYTK